MMPSRRIVTVWCPDWPIIATGTSADIPALVLRASRVVARSPAAAHQGVAIGQRRREAQRLCPDIIVIPHDGERDARAFEPVLQAIGQFTPRLDIVEPGWVCVDARGPSRYFGGDQRLAERLVAAVTAAVPASVPPTEAVAVQIGIADGRFPSALAARRAVGDPLVIAPGGSPAFLAPLPVSSLHHTGEVDADLVGLLARLGIHRLGDLAALPVADVLDRFGPPGGHAHRLAAGHDERAIRGDDPPHRQQVGQAFDDPVVQLTTLAFVGKRLADQLAGELSDHGSVCTRLVVTAETEHGERSERAWYRAAGLSAPAMMERIRWQLAAWTSAGEITAGVVVLRLTADEVRHDDGEQAGLWGGRSEADERALRTIARLTGMVGDDAVLVPAWHGGRLPGDRYEWIPAAVTDLGDASRRVRPPDGPPWPGALPTPSPAMVLPEVRPVDLADHHGQALLVSGRGELSGDPAILVLDGRTPRRVVGWSGPWPLDECWWDPRRERRAARLQVVTDDGAAHLLLAQARRWWVAATYG